MLSHDALTLIALKCGTRINIYIYYLYATKYCHSMMGMTAASTIPVIVMMVMNLLLLGGVDGGVGGRSVLGLPQL